MILNKLSLVSSSAKFIVVGLLSIKFSQLKAL